MEISLNIDEFKKEYLLSLEEELGNLENTILDLEKISDEEVLGQKVYEIFRSIHSFKGSSGTYELYMLASIFHRLEDFLSKYINNTENQIDVDSLLKFLDIAKSCAEDYKNGEEELEKYNTVIEDLTQTSRTNNGKILLVEPTNSIKKIISKSAQESEIDITVMENGATALNRVLHERFDLIICSANIEGLDGVSLLKGIRIMKNLNQKTPCALISSNESYSELEGTKLFDYVVKDKDFISNIGNYIRRVVLKVEEPKLDLDFQFKHVLYVEDDRMIQKVVQRVFDHTDNTKLTIAGNKQNALMAVANEKPDLIILDYFLKDCVGPDILKDLHERNWNGDIPIIFMTSSREKVDVEAMKKIGNVKGVIEKPIKIRTLLKELTQVATS